MLSERQCFNPRSGRTTTGRRYYLTSLPAAARLLATAIRRHWQVEPERSGDSRRQNSVHWVLDVIFREDAHRARSGYAATNLSLLRRSALNLLRHHTTCGDKSYLRGRRLMAGWNPAYLADVVAPLLKPA